MDERIYICIDLKTFYASVECAERGLDPFKTNLVVADPKRGESKAICLAITPALKAHGVRNRCRLFEIPKNIKYITALPHMRLYIDYATRIYKIYLRYISSTDIYPYSIDEMFIDVTSYLKLYKKTAEELAKFLMREIYEELHITATCGIGTNLYLCKIALDIEAKHSPSNIGYLDKKLFDEKMIYHRPLSDFWQISTGIETRLNRMGIFDMAGIRSCDEEKLYKEFGINAEILIDHAYGIEDVTIDDIKRYIPKSNSVSHSQVLACGYEYFKGRLALTEMVELASLDLIDRHVITSHISLMIIYVDKEKSSKSYTMDIATNVFSLLLESFLKIYDSITIRGKEIRKIGLSFNNVFSEDDEYFDLFTDPLKIRKERNLEKTINSIRKKYGKNSLLKGMNLLEGATTLKRNKLIGGHNSGEDEKTKNE